VIGLGLRQLQDALNKRADTIQREFTAVGERLKAVSRQMLEVGVGNLDPLLAEQEALHARQQALAEEVNLWRDRARAVLKQASDEALRAYLDELRAASDESLRPAVERAIYLLDAPEEELIALAHQTTPVRPLTPAGRLIERARTEFDLRGTDPDPRRRAAVEFANRPGMAQDDAAIEEIEAAMDDPDPLVKEIATLTAIQLHRFRATRLADLQVGHEAVKHLAHIPHPAVIPVLIEILENPRTGFLKDENGVVEGDNGRSRGLALTRLVEWRTPEAQAAVRGRQFDRDPRIVKAAARALELFPGEWKGSGKAPLSEG
jgi:hypothetical protein